MKLSPSASLPKDLLDARLALRQHLMNEYGSQLKRSKVAPYNLMNKPSKLMAWIVAARHKTKIPFLLSPTRSHTIFNPQDIADAFSDYYSKLYNLKHDSHTDTPTAKQIDYFLESIKLRTLSEEHLLDLNFPVTEKKIAPVIMTLPNGKSPGPDGYSNEYIKSFQHNLLPYICSIFNLLAQKD